MDFKYDKFETVFVLDEEELPIYIEKQHVLGGHKVYRQIYKDAQEDHNIGNITENMVRYVKNLCDVCTKTVPREGKIKRKTDYEPIVTNYVFQKLQIDLVDCRSVSKYSTFGHKWILHFTQLMLW